MMTRFFFMNIIAMTIFLGLGTAVHRLLLRRELSRPKETYLPRAHNNREKTLLVMEIGASLFLPFQLLLMNKLKGNTHHE